MIKPKQTRVISFVVIAYNARDTICRCVKSILAQEVEKNIYLVDNNSMDDTMQQVSDLPVVRLFEAHCCRGAARNRGLTAAKDPYVAFVDSDVELPKGWAQKALDLLQTHPEVAAVGGPGISSQKSWVSCSIDVLQYGKITSGNDQYVTSLATMDIVYRRAAIANMRFKELWTAEDAEFNFRIIENGYRLLWSKSLHVWHHHPVTLWQLIKKSFKFGAWYPTPYWKHPRRITLGFLARLLYVPGLLLWVVFSLFWPMFWWAFGAWCLIPMFAYFALAIRARIVGNPRRLVAFLIVHSIKQYAQTAGVWGGILLGKGRIS